jgi:hypothetical protein
LKHCVSSFVPPLKATLPSIIGDIENQNNSNGDENNDNDIESPLHLDRSTPGMDGSSHDDDEEPPPLLDRSAPDFDSSSDDDDDEDVYTQADVDDDDDLYVMDPLAHLAHLFPGETWDDVDEAPGMFSMTLQVESNMIQFNESSGSAIQRLHRERTLKCPVCAEPYLDYYDSDHPNRLPARKTPQSCCSHGATMIFIKLDSCPVCMDDMVEPPVVALPCGHVICQADFVTLGGIVGPRPSHKPEPLPLSCGSNLLSL